LAGKIFEANFILEIVNCKLGKNANFEFFKTFVLKKNYNAKFFINIDSEI
jgi:hypothetical protein